MQAQLIARYKSQLCTAEISRVGYETYDERWEKRHNMIFDEVFGIGK